MARYHQWQERTCFFVYKPFKMCICYVIVFPFTILCKTLLCVKSTFLVITVIEEIEEMIRLIPEGWFPQ